MMGSARWIGLTWGVMTLACGSGTLKAPARDAGNTGGAYTGGVLGAGGVQGSGGHTTSAASGGVTSPSGTGGQSGGAGASTYGTRDAGTSAQAGVGGGAATSGGGATGPDVAAAIDAPARTDGAPSGAGGAQAFDGGFGDVGDALGAFCTGSQGKLESKGQRYTGSVTSKVTDPFLDCCVAYAARFPTKALLGVDVEAVVRLSAGSSTGGVVPLGESMVSASLRASTSTDDAGRPADAPLTGSVRIDGTPWSSEPWTLGLCAQVVDTSGAWPGTRIYVPGVPVAPEQWRTRFRLWLLRDASMGADQAEQIGLDKLELATSPLLDLMHLDFVELASKRCPSIEDATCTWMGLNTIFMHGSSLLGKIGTITSPYGVPFVVEADGQRIYLGAFTSVMSSAAIHGPTALVEDILDEGFAIYPPINTAPGSVDPRNDPRIVKVLTEAGKSIP